MTRGNVQTVLRPHAHWPAFTLTELLAALCCVALLLALLLPAGAATREQDHKAQSLSNVKQLGEALRSFAEDHDKQLPWGIENGFPAWDRDALPWATWAAKLRDGTFKWGKDEGYVKDFRVFWGPKRDLEFAEEHFNENWNFRRPGYGANIAGAMPREGQKEKLQPLRLGEFDQPDALLLLTEVFNKKEYPQIDGEYYVDPQLDETRRPNKAQVHLITYQGGAPRVYLDGHGDAGDSTEIGWKAESMREGHWTNWPASALKQAPWFQRK